MTTRVAILGAGDLGKTLAMHLRSQAALVPAGFLDDKVREPLVHDLPRFGEFRDAVALHADGCFDALVVGVGYKHLAARERLFDDLRARGIPFVSIVHPSCAVAASARVEDGAVLFAGCVLDEGVVVGANSILNTGCVVAHDTKVGRHSFLGPGVTLAGFVEVGVRCFLGVGTVVIDNVRIGNDVQTGGGTVVIADLASGAVAVGVPARILRSNKPGASSFS